MKSLIQFPDPNQADDEGLVAAGGELSEDFLLSAYSQGIFPWFGEEDPILWWSPNPRLVLYPSDFKISKSFQQLIRSNKYSIRIDISFEKVINNCASVPRPDQAGTWITKEMINAYIELHKLGYAHSFETWFKGELVGGLYGVSLGKAFFGESMFFKERDASKYALYHLVEWCINHDFDFIDAQQSTNHMKSLGAVEVQRSDFLLQLKKSLQNSSVIGKWN